MLPDLLTAGAMDCVLNPQNNILYASQQLLYKCILVKKKVLEAVFTHNCVRLLTSKHFMAFFFLSGCVVL